MFQSRGSTRPLWLFGSIALTVSRRAGRVPKAVGFALTQHRCRGRL
jgi:hypothetical protein